MEDNPFINFVLFSVVGVDITLGNILLFALVLGAWFAGYFVILEKMLKRYLKSQELERSVSSRIMRMTRLTYVFLLLLLSIASLGVNVSLYSNNDLNIDVLIVAGSLFAFQLAQLLDWLFSRVFFRQYYMQVPSDLRKGITRQKPVGTTKGEHTFQFIVYTLAVIFVIQAMGVNEPLFSYQVKDKSLDFRISDILEIALIFLAARLAIWFLTQVVLGNYFKRQNIDYGSQFAINQLLKYFIYIVAGLLALESVGIQPTVLLAGSAALLVGIGLGLQQTFNDLISGIILLFDRTVEVGDFVQLGSLVGVVKKIGIRTSVLETRDDISVIVPNSKLVGEQVVNWNHSDDKARFSVAVGVAYGTDTTLVKNLLLSVAKENPDILPTPEPFVRFTNFGDSSLDFELHFWSTRFMIIENVKSDLRFSIDDVFRKNNISIPFPQRDVWMRS
ncbi:MAG: mechanosensitive ion channel [Saprospiraceae bacterium]|jgi:small-conductance mechanosensitive channel|nr:mechanosensitive ion channel [Saprospiraceae bacterium]MDP4820283.1 mechanosensitive ion channel [Saprospiraceae bacterium]MDP4999978.1 mechanosensitive ion channel [Saprospiraceae bacterium]